MSSELNHYPKKKLKNNDILTAEVINFPSELKDKKDIKIDNLDFWKINDKKNSDQFKAVMGICYMISALIVMGLYSSFL